MPATLFATVLLAALALPPAPAPTAPAWPPVAVARRISPSVVGIVNLQGSPDGPLIARGSGSGLVVRSDGYIVTNDHVVAGATRLKVMLQGGRTYPARLVGEDPLTDIAVVRIPAKGLPAAQLTPHQPEVGEMAIAIGNPMGLGFARTVTVGVVSGIDRSLGQGYAQRAYGLIQTDAAINPGNSGGPLCDAEGEVIGINSVKISSIGFESMGFAIPAQVVGPVVDALIASGRVPRPWLGISAGETQPPSAGAAQGGVVLTAVAAGGPAARAGLLPHDVIVELNRLKIPNLTSLYRVLADLRPGDTVQVTVRRGARTLGFSVRLEELPGAGKASS